MDPDRKTLLYGPFRAFNDQSKNDKDKQQIPERSTPATFGNDNHSNDEIPYKNTTG